MRKISWPWPECNQFQRWSGYINMSNFRPFLPCVLKINIPWSKSNLFWGWPEYTNMPNLRPFSVVFSRKCPEIANLPDSHSRNVAKMRKINRRWPKSKISSQDVQDTSVCWIMTTSSNGNILRVTGPLCGGFTGHRWIPLTKASDAELWCFLWSAPE